MKRPSPHGGSSSRSDGRRVAHLTSAETASSGVQFAPVLFCRVVVAVAECTDALKKGGWAFRNDTDRTLS